MFEKVRRVSWIAQALIALGLSVVLTRVPFYSFESSLYDLRVRFSPKPDSEGIVQLIPIDRKTVDMYGRPPEVSDFTNLLLELASESPRAIVYLGDPLKWKGLPEDKKTFAEIAEKHPEFHFTVNDVVPSTQRATLVLPKPFERLIPEEWPNTRDAMIFAQDKVTRRIIIAFENRPLLAASLAGHFNSILEPRNYRGSFDYEGSVQTNIRYHDRNSFPKLSFIDVASGRFAQGQFKNKIILIGNDNEFDLEDYALTPLSRSPLAMSKLEVQGHSLATLIHNNGPLKVPAWIDLVITFLISLLTVRAVWALRPVTCLISLALAASGMSLFGWFMFASFGLWINLIHPLLAIFVTYYFFIPYRLIIENKKSWEYYEKNKLLTQVEELKSNFLSMMSHDLKTPIARIRGMAETALAAEGELAAPQEEALHSIVQSSDELGHFVSSILDLGRIESKEVKLQKTSKDINSLVKDCAKKFEFSAKSKSISFKLNLEPLFSIAMDVDLIKQVLSNLIENAVKYSPENSVIEINTSERDGQVVVQVINSGPGIPFDEQENIFLKFYRSKQVKTSPIKGSGLGLYLAKYFVDLHNGSIVVDSQPNAKTTFTVGLPV